MIREGFIFSVLVAYTLAELSCSGCRDPVLELRVWTDNSTIWKCEKMQRIFADKCKDEVEVYCNRQQFLGGSLYIMTFPDSPENFGIKPDHVRKSNGTSVRVTMNCADGQWTIRNRKRAQTYILCDQFITEENRPGSFTKKTDYPANVTTTVAIDKEIEVIKNSASQVSTTSIPYDFADLIYPSHSGRQGKYRKFKAKLIKGSSKRKTKRLLTKPIRRRSLAHKRRGNRIAFQRKILIRKVVQPMRRKKSFGKRRQRHSFKKLIKMHNF